MYCSSNDLTELDVSNNPRLVSLSCSRNHLIKLDISNTPHLASLLCSRNQLIEIDVRNNPNLYELYFYNNRIREINVTKNPKLRNLSCTNNLLSELDISHNPKLQALDCGGNYLATLDLSRNPALTELYFSGTTLRSVDLSANTELISLDCISTDIMPLDLSANSSLDALGSYGNSRLEALYITSTDNPAFPYTTDLREYNGSSYTRITSVKAYSRNDAEIPSSFTQGQYTALFSQHPHYIIYEYDTGYTGTASEDSVPRRMSVRVSVPSLNFTYLPKIESKVVSVDSKVVSVDEAVSFYATSITTPEHPESPSQPEAPDITPEPEPETPDSPTDNAASSSGGGCNSGLGLLASCAVMLIRRKRSALSALCLVPVMASCSWGAGIKTADYTLPIPYETYAISGTYSTNFTLTPELVNTVAEIAHVSSDRIHSFSDISSMRAGTSYPSTSTTSRARENTAE
ncbi:MAG: hypothetical protein IJS28_10420 [Synergistaceae bacterium]|nr:hypothetical protein [Synergistaceae bacterium]